MSVFGLIKRSRQAAKEHKAEKAEKQKLEESKPAYKHVPMHAAVDALSGAPSSWRNEDRPRIMEQNRRRSAMAASGMSQHPMMGMSPVHMGMPRVNSALSHVSYPSVYANPVVAVPRNYSYNGSIHNHQAWADRAAEVVYSNPENPPSSNPAASLGKGKGVERVIMVDSGRVSQSSSKAPSPVGSSGDSTSSQDDLEMKTVRQPRTNTNTSMDMYMSPAIPPAGRDVPSPQDTKPSPRPSGSTPDHVVHRLHPSQSRSRRTSDPPPATNPPCGAPADRSYPPRAGYSYHCSRPIPSHSGSTVPRPGSASMPSAMGIPPVPALPPMSFGPSLASSTGSSSSSGSPTMANSTPISPGVMNSAVSTVPSTSPADSARAESPVSPISPVTPASVLPVVVTELQFDFPFKSHSSSPSSSPMIAPTIPTSMPQLPSIGSAAVTARPAHRSSRVPKAPRFPDLEPIESNTVSYAVSPRTAPLSRTTTLNTTNGLDVRVESGKHRQESHIKKPGGKAKLTKAPQGAAEKPAKKSRWSFRGKSTPVAG